MNFHTLFLIILNLTAVRAFDILGGAGVLRVEEEAEPLLLAAQIQTEIQSFDSSRAE